MIPNINKKIKKQFVKKYKEIEIELPDDQLLFLCLEAHKQNITLNKFINNLLKSQLDKMIKEFK